MNNIPPFTKLYPDASQSTIDVPPKAKISSYLFNRILEMNFSDLKFFENIDVSKLKKIPQDFEDFKKAMNNVVNLGIFLFMSAQHINLEKTQFFIKKISKIDKKLAPEVFGGGHWILF